MGDLFLLYDFQVLKIYYFYNERKHTLIKWLVFARTGLCAKDMKMKRDMLSDIYRVFPDDTKMYKININFIEILLRKNVIKYLVSAFHVYLVQSTQQSNEEDDSLFTDRKLSFREAMQLVQSDMVSKRLSLAWLEVHS